MTSFLYNIISGVDDVKTKETFIESRTGKIDQSYSVEKITTEIIPNTWEEVFKDSIYDFQHISSILDREEQSGRKYSPLKKDLFNAFYYTPLNEVKVVIIGQDPYPQLININGKAVPRSVGLSFSVRKEDSIPISLKNIYKELASTIKGFKIPNHGDLREWAVQGILMLNTCLTTQIDKSESHKELWMGFIGKVLKKIATKNPNCIYILWGNKARSLKPLLGEKSIVFEAAHPSGFSASGFFGCNHFNLINNALIKQGKNGINWNLSSVEELSSNYFFSNAINNIMGYNNQSNNDYSNIDINNLPNY